MNKYAKPSRQAAPMRAPRKKNHRQGKPKPAAVLCASQQEVLGLVRELRSRQSEIELQNIELRRAMAEIIEQRHAEDSLQKLQETLERTIEDRSAELRIASELLNSIFASIDLHIACLDPDLNFIAVNEVYAAADHRAPEFYPGKNYVDVCPDEENEAILKDVLETGEPYYEYEKPVVSALHAERGVTYWDWSVQPIKGRGNAVTGLVLSMINVTDRKRAEENTLRLAAAIESAGDSVIITDVRGMIKYVNPAFEKMTGYNQKEALGRDKDMLESGRQDEAFYRNVRETIRRRGSWTGRVINKKKDGTVYTEECTWSVIRNQSGGIMNYVSIGRDITGKLRLETMARTANSGSLSPRVRHEIADHINSLVGRLNPLKVKFDHMDKSDIERQVEVCLGEALKISDLLKT